jgi:hypothetical protein
VVGGGGDGGSTRRCTGGSEVAERPADARTPARCGTMRAKSGRGSFPRSCRRCARGPGERPLGARRVAGSALAVCVGTAHRGMARRRVHDVERVHNDISTTSVHRCSHDSTRGRMVLARTRALARCGRHLTLFLNLFTPLKNA